MVQTVTADDFARTYSPNVTDTLFQRIPGVTLSDPNGNGAQQEIRYRGFAASPLQGTPQGLAVYMNGIRINEAFGDTVNWDLIPTNAIDRADIWTNNPIFGLNALGGAINLQMKNGFTYQGFEVEGQGGSFGRISGSVQYGAQQRTTAALYVAAQGVARRRLAAEIAGRARPHLWRSRLARTTATSSISSRSAASTSFGVAAATPIQLLDRDWTSIYTTPQTTNNEMVLLAPQRQVRARPTPGRCRATSMCAASASAMSTATTATSSAAATPRSVSSQPALPGGRRLPAPEPVRRRRGAAFRNQFAILDQNNNPIPCPPGAGNTCAPVPYGTIDRTQHRRRTRSAARCRRTNDAKMFGHDNHFVVGGSIDHSASRFRRDQHSSASSSRTSRVGINPAIPGNGAIIHTLGNLGYGPVELNARNTYYGLYATDTFDITAQLSATAGARLNVAKITDHGPARHQPGPQQQARPTRGSIRWPA